MRQDRDQEVDNLLKSGRRVLLPLDRTDPDEPAAPRRTAAGPELADGSVGLAERIENLSYAIEKMNLAEYTELLRKPGRLIWVNFVAGTARGIGMAVGFSVLGAVLLYILKNFLATHLPELADLTATIVKMVELNLRP